MRTAISWNLVAVTSIKSGKQVPICLLSRGTIVVLRISEAASLALHTIVMLAENVGSLLSTGHIASKLGVSEAHLAKVLQRLSKAGYVKSTRGPGGGFVLAKRLDEVRLLDIYELIEGPLEPTTCLLNKPVCNGHCILGGLLGSLNRQVRERLSELTLSSLVPAQRRCDAKV